MARTHTGHGDVDEERRARKARQLDERRAARQRAIKNGLGARGSERLR